MRIELNNTPEVVCANEANLMPGDVFITEGNGAFLILKSNWAADLRINEYTTVGQIYGKGRKASKTMLHVEL